MTEPLQIGDTVRFRFDTLHEKEGDIGKVTKVERCGPHLSLNFYVKWPHLKRPMLYQQNHIGSCLDKVTL